MSNILYLNPKTKSNQDVINAAFDTLQDNSSYDTIYLNEGKYVIDEPIKTTNSFTLTGDKNAIISLQDDCGWSKDVPLIKQESPSKSSTGQIKINGFQIDGNYAGNSDVSRGSSFYTLFWFYYNDVEVSDMYLHDSHNDGLKVQYSNSVKFYNNSIYKLGHDAVYALTCNNIEYYNNTCRTKTNSACRLKESSHARIYNNEIYTQFEEDAGGPGIQVQFSKNYNVPSCTDIEIFNNNIHDTYGPGIWLIGFGGNKYTKEQATGVKIYNNKFTGCGTHKTYNWLGGIVLSGFYDTLIEGNTFDGNYGHGIAYMYPNDSRFAGLQPNGEGEYTTIVRNNLIKNTILRKGNTNGTIAADYTKTGIGIADYYPDSHTFTCEGNTFSGNVRDYLNVKEVPSVVGASSMYDNRMKETSSSTVYAAPTFLDVGKLGTSKYRSLIYFDLSEYKEEVEKAVLSLNWYYPANARLKDTVVEIYRPASAWNTQKVSWAYRDSNVKWVKAGGDWIDCDGLGQGTCPYASVVFAGKVVPNSKYYDFDVTKLVNEYISGKYPNTGFLLKAQLEADNYIAFYGLKADLKPILTFTRKPVSKPAVKITFENEEKLKEVCNKIVAEGLVLEEQFEFENVSEGFTL